MEHIPVRGPDSVERVRCGGKMHKGLAPQSAVRVELDEGGVGHGGVEGGGGSGGVKRGGCTCSCMFAFASDVPSPSPSSPFLIASPPSTSSSTSSPRGHPIPAPLLAHVCPKHPDQVVGGGAAGQVLDVEGMPRGARNVGGELGHQLIGRHAATLKLRGAEEGGRRG